MMPPSFAGILLAQMRSRNAWASAPGHLELGEGREVHEARRARAPPSASSRTASHQFERLKENCFALAGRVVPARPLPAENLRELRAFAFSASRAAADLRKFAPHLVLLGRLVAVIHVMIVGDRDFRGVVLARPVAEAARIEFAHVDLGLAMHHPLREIFAGAAALADADRGAAMHPVVLGGRAPGPRDRRRPACG